MPEIACSPLRRPSRTPLLRAAAAGLLTTCVLALSCASAAPAQAAEPGVGVGNPTPGEIAGVRALGVHWVRMFLTWPDTSPPARGLRGHTWLASYEQLFSQLSPGTKVILVVVDTPRWETEASA